MARTEITPDLQHAIAEAIERHGSGKAAAEALGLGESTVSKYRPRAPIAHEGISVDQIRALIAEAVRAQVGQPASLADSARAVEPAPAERTVTLRKPYRKVLFLSDTHHPFHDPAAISAVLDFAHDFGPDLVVLAGDCLDCYAISRWPKDPDRRMNLQDEADSLKPFIAGIDALGCHCDVEWIDGNHEHRIARLIAEAAPGLHKLRGLSIPELCGLPKRWTHRPNQTHLRLGRLVMHHGDLAGGGGGGVYPAACMLRKIRTSSIFGHWHRQGAHFATDYDGSLQGSYANGHLADTRQVDYQRVPDWVQGVSTIEFHWEPVEHFQVTQHPIVRGRIAGNGRLCGGG